ncbi:metallophosphoesterase, partial [Bacillus cereus group sp. BC26]
IVRAVNALDADLVVVTGDVVDGSVKRLRDHTAPLGRMQSRHGSFLVTGNHEYYAGAHAWIDEFRRIGLTVLLNEHVLIEHDGA